MSYEKLVADHYVHGELLSAIEAALAGLGRTRETVAIEDLAPVDEFHVGGRPATKKLIRQLGLSAGDRILDVGCGLGGAARYVVSTFDTCVTGIDLTAEYVETGNALCKWVGLSDRIILQQGSALDMPFEDGSFDGGYLIHVGMNVESKALLFAEIARVLGPAAKFGVYDIMRQEVGDLAFPVPWAGSDDTNQLATPAQYRQALEGAGFEVLAEDNRRDFALEFFQEIRAKAKASGSPAPLGLHTLMQASTGSKVKNMIDNIQARLVAPVELIARKR